MKITDTYQAARDMTSTHIERAHTGLFRGLFCTGSTRQVMEDDTLAILRALGDDGTHLRQAVALAVMGVPDDVVEQVLHRFAQGDETP